MPAPSFSEQLVLARENTGLTMVQAAKLMPRTTYQQLWYLEGNDKRRPPNSAERVSFATMVDIVTVYWPQLSLGDLLPDAGLEFYAP